MKEQSERLEFAMLAAKACNTSIPLSAYKASRIGDDFISLTEQEYNEAWKIGTLRRLASEVQGDIENYDGSEDQAIRLNQIGALPEKAIEKYFGFNVEPTIHLKRSLEL